MIGLPCGSCWSKTNRTPRMCWPRGCASRPTPSTWPATATPPSFRSATTDYDAVILDVMLPSRDGFAVCRTIRESGCAVPILMVTARDAVEARIEGLDCGADDYLVKPFDFGELLARLRALIRRGRQPLLPERLTRRAARRSTRAAGGRASATRDVPLTAKEYALLEYLVAPRRRRRQPRRHRRARLGRALRSAVERRRRLRAAAAAQARSRRDRDVADPHAARRRLPAGGGRRRVMTRCRCGRG